jgi:DNA primase
MDIIDEIKSKITIEQLVSQYVKLKASGRNLKGLCPFHQEKSPSFMVSPEKQIAWCFGCQKGGDIFSFIQEVENCDFKEAIKILAERSGVDVTQFSLKADPKASLYIKEEKDILYEINKLANDFYKQELKTTDEGKKVIK